MDRTSEELASEALQHVLEKLAFMFAEPADRCNLPRDGEFLCADIVFEGVRSGGMTLAVAGSLTPALSANMLGIEPDDPMALAGGEDSLKELLNVICGSFLTALVGSQPVFRLDVPQARALNEAEWTALMEDSDTLPYVVDAEHAALLKVHME